MGEQTQTGTKKAIRLITPSTVLSIKHLPILRCTKQSIFSHLHHQRVKKLLHTGDPVVVEVGSRWLSTGCNWFQRQLQLPAVIIVPQSKLLKTAHRQIRRFNNNTMDTDYPCRHSHRREYSVQSHLSVCLFVRAPKGKRLELSTPNSVSIYSIAVARHALTQKSKGQGHMVTKTVMVAWLPVTMSWISYTNTPLCYLHRCRRGSACRYDCLCFLVHWLTMFPANL